MKYLVKSIADMHKNSISKYIVGQYPKDKDQLNKNYYDFGDHYYSYVDSVANKSIILHFPYNEIRPNEMIYYLPGDIYPTSWSLSVSNDGINWIELKYSDSAMCPKELQQEVISDGLHWSDYCSKTIVIIPFKNTKSYKYVKYTQYNNSYILDNNYKHLITNYGIDFNGIFITDYNVYRPLLMNSLY